MSSNGRSKRNLMKMKLLLSSIERSEIVPGAAVYGVSTFASKRKSRASLSNIFSVTKREQLEIHGSQLIPLSLPTCYTRG